MCDFVGEVLKKEGVGERPFRHDGVLEFKISTPYPLFLKIKNSPYKSDSH